ncbi:hypothetical protein G6F31_010933 [Rhizopus arrhizus]|nr:hypothetical protein G6F31_010933 [Rhizopus arrhizus]
MQQSTAVPENEREHTTFEVYLPSDPMNEEVYECKSLTNGDILSMVWKYTDLFDKKTIISFGKWCMNKADFTAAHSKRRQCDSGKVSVRSLFVAKEQYIAKKVLDYLPHYQLFVKNLKEEKYNIIGYARKSRTNENDESRVRLLQQMTRRLKERSLVDKVFVSPRANANDLMVERDLTKDEDLLKQLNVDGDAQDLLNYINQNKKICLIILGYAGLSTNCKDLETFLRNSKNICKIIVDHLPFDNTIKILDCCELLQDPKNWRFSTVEQGHTRDQSDSNFYDLFIYHYSAHQY